MANREEIPYMRLLHPLFKEIILVEQQDLRPHAPERTEHSSLSSPPRTSDVRLNHCERVILSHTTIASSMRFWR